MQLQSKTLKSILAASVIMTACAASGPAAASGAVAKADADFQTICEAFGGRFSQTWLYNDQGAKWGEVETCKTLAGTVTCQSGVCRSDRQRYEALRAGKASADAQKRDAAHEPFHAEAPKIIEALTNLNVN